MTVARALGEERVRGCSCFGHGHCLDDFYTLRHHTHAYALLLLGDEPEVRCAEQQNRSGALPSSALPSESRETSVEVHTITCFVVCTCSCAAVHPDGYAHSVGAAMRAREAAAEATFPADLALGIEERGTPATSVLSTGTPAAVSAVVVVAAVVLTVAAMEAGVPAEAPVVEPAAELTTATVGQGGSCFVSRLHRSEISSHPFALRLLFFVQVVATVPAVVACWCSCCGTTAEANPRSRWVSGIALDDRRNIGYGVPAETAAMLLVYAVLSGIMELQLTFAAPAPPRPAPPPRRSAFLSPLAPPPPCSLTASVVSGLSMSLMRMVPVPAWCS
ncbi:hypothetical protein, conserved [Leishmania tarentolae]|uniref:Uncharacterized protein n=1 Tax=Leishmania tarentolae TaxID=5689 RepID=A0A640KIB7_LEITA|nr:hypothetical protein, conserved [Leishmania tarentolae]